VAYRAGEQMVVARCPGKVADLERLLGAHVPGASLAIGHTRWATHGSPTEANAHPHADCTGRLVVVHNGIVENHAVLRAKLTAAGHVFRSQTDTEVIAHAIEAELSGRTGADGLVEAVRRACARLAGSFAVALAWSGLPDAIVAVRHESPMIVGIRDGCAFVASDVPALVGWADHMVALEDGDIAVVRGDGIRVFGMDGAPRERATTRLRAGREEAEKGGYPHFMLKEIHEEPRAVRETLRGRIGDDGSVALDGLPERVSRLLRTGDVHFVACGTAHHAGMIGARMWEQLLSRRATARVSSEFRYDAPLLDEQSLVVLISQSGETADTIAAAREARRRGAATLAVANCSGSSLERETDGVLATRAGLEIGVASTKAYAAQVAAMGLLAGSAGWNDAGRSLLALPDAIKAALGLEDAIRLLADRLHTSDCFFFLGRGHDAAVAAEAALKLKEISYIHAEAYPAGEMKHGPLALVEPGVTVVGLCTRERTHQKMDANLMEVKARSGRVLAVVAEGLEPPGAADDVLVVPAVNELLSPVVTMVAMQMLAYYVACARGCSVDQPRNLAKSVTVE
jgi:glucosamine--fructose-6-phosphate aminotransferase (isomerizing)